LHKDPETPAWIRIGGPTVYEWDFEGQRRHGYSLGIPSAADRHFHGLIDDPNKMPTKDG
jgi:hypothetical protein